MDRPENPVLMMALTTEKQPRHEKAWRPRPRPPWATPAAFLRQTKSGDVRPDHPAVSFRRLRDFAGSSSQWLERRAGTITYGAFVEQSGRPRPLPMRHYFGLTICGRDLFARTRAGHANSLAGGRCRRDHRDGRCTLYGADRWLCPRADAP